jgi:sulfur carrier protein
MKVIINGKETTIADGLNIKDLIQSELKNYGNFNGIAVALNYNVIHRQDWEETFVKENDVIDIVTAMQGG